MLRREMINEFVQKSGLRNNIIFPKAVAAAYAIGYIVCELSWPSTSILEDEPKVKKGSN
jgi:hypothetical protein